MNLREVWKIKKWIFFHQFGRLFILGTILRWLGNFNSCPGGRIKPLSAFIALPLPYILWHSKPFLALPKTGLAPRNSGTRLGLKKALIRGLENAFFSAEWTVSAGQCGIWVEGQLDDKQKSYRTNKTGLLAIKKMSSLPRFFRVFGANNSKFSIVIFSQILKALSSLKIIIE